MSINKTEKNFNFPDGRQILIKYEGTTIVRCFISPPPGQRALSMEELKEDEFYSDISIKQNRFIVATKKVGDKTTITIIDVETEKILADDWEYERQSLSHFCTVEQHDFYLVSEPSQSENIIKHLFAPNCNNPKETLEVYALPINNIVELKGQSAGIHDEVGLVSDTGTIVYCPYFNKRTREQPLKELVPVALSCFHNEQLSLFKNTRTNKYVFVYYPINNVSKYFVDEKESIHLFLETSLGTNDIYGFIIEKENEDSPVSVYVVPGNHPSSLQELREYKLCDWDCVSLSGVQRLENINESYHWNDWPRIRANNYKPCFYYKKENGENGILEIFKTNHLWRTGNEEDKLSTVICKYSPPADDGIVPRAFCHYQCGSKWDGTQTLDFYSLIHVTENDRLKMRLVINDDNKAPCWSEFTSKNGCLFDEIFVNKEYIALRNENACEVYCAKTGRKLASFSNRVTIYQLPHDKVEFEEPDGNIYTFDHLTGSISCSKVSCSTTWRKSTSFCWDKVNGNYQVCYRACYDGTETKTEVCEGSLPCFIDLCTETELDITRKFEKNNLKKMLTNVN